MQGCVTKVYESENNYHMVLGKSGASTSQDSSSENKEFLLAKRDLYLERKQQT